LDVVRIDAPLAALVIAQQRHTPGVVMPHVPEKPATMRRTS
jgi:hypothetical protein